MLAPVLILTAVGAGTKKCRALTAERTTTFRSLSGWKKFSRAFAALIRRTSGLAHPQLRCVRLELDPRQLACRLVELP